MEGLRREQSRCSGTCVHRPTFGKDAEGNYLTSTLSCYPSPMCAYLAEVTVRELEAKLCSRAGPSEQADGEDSCGQLSRCPLRLARSCWSFEGSPGLLKDFALLNEIAPRGVTTVLKESSVAAYMHVDDGLFLCCSKIRPSLSRVWAERWRPRIQSKR